MTNSSQNSDSIYDLLIIGGGINGVGVARDAAGRGLKVCLLEKGDLGGATSSASSKLVHGGLRYLEFYEFGLVRKALVEREVILRNAPHISRAMAFLLPYEDHQRPAWMIKAGLFLYDSMSPGDEVEKSERVELQKIAAGPAFAKHLTAGFRYWDGWVDDARLVVLNARDAADRGADICPREGAIEAIRTPENLWEVTTDKGRVLHARKLLNCAGPWAEIVAREVMGLDDAPRLSLVQGAHIVTRKVNRTQEAWMLQQPDGRIIFVIPFDREYSLIGTTETPVDTPENCYPTEDEENYLLEAVNRSLAKPLSKADIVHRFAGVRPLVLEEGKGARETTRDWKLVNHAEAEGMTVIGGKITTYRVLAEAVLKELFPDTDTWTADEPLPGGDIPRTSEPVYKDFDLWRSHLRARHFLYDPKIVDRLARLYGTLADTMLEAGLGEQIGGMFEAELIHLRDKEWATCADDVIWRRTKSGLRLDDNQKAQIQAWFDAQDQG